MKEREPKTLTVREVAAMTGAAERSVRLWVKEDKFPGAKLEETPVGQFWLIPDTALEGFVKRDRGRPPKPKTEKKDKMK